jgi:2'-5' RNA ligase
VSTEARLFLALWPSTGTRRALAEHQSLWKWPAGALPIAPDAMHVTLHFIGAVPEGDVERIGERLQVAQRPITLTLGRPAMWPRGTAVLQPTHVPSALKDLHDALAEALRGLDLPVEEQRFKPHVTLARKAAAATLPAEPVTAVIWRAIGGYALVQSNGRYRVLRRFPLPEASD